MLVALVTWPMVTRPPYLCKYAFDVTGTVGVVARGAAENPGAAPQSFHQQFLRPWIVGQSLLGEHADLQIDRPSVFADQRQNTFQAAQPDARIDLQMGAHMGRTLEDRLLQSAARTSVNVLGRE